VDFKTVKNLLFGIVFVLLTGFMANRLYVGLSRSQLNVKGITYSRERTPIAYWISMTMAAFGLLFGLVMCFAAAEGAFG
jgi:hypothetical protein